MMQPGGEDVRRMWTSKMVTARLLAPLMILWLPARAHAQLADSNAQTDPNAAAPAAPAPATQATPARAASAAAGFAAPENFFGLKPGHGRVIAFEEAMGLTLKSSFDLKIAQEKLYQSNLLIRKAWSSVLPRLSATANYTFSWPQIQFQGVTQGQLDAQAAGQRSQMENQAKIYDAQAAASAADGNYNSEYANRALASQIRGQESSVVAGKAADPVAISPAHVLGGGLNMSFVLFNGRAIPLLYNAYDTVKQTHATLDRARTTALYMAALAYYNAVSARRLLGIAQMQTRNLELHLQMTRVRVEVGTLAPLALRRAESDLERSKASVRTSSNAYKAAVGGLGMTLGMDEEFDVGELPEVPVFEERFSEDELISHAEANRPDLAAAKLGVAMAERNRVDAIMRWMPTVTLNTAARATSNVRGFQKDPVSYAVMLNGTLPLYDGGDRYTAWRESGSQVREAGLNLQQQRWKLSMAVRGNLREVQLRKDNLVNQRLALQLAQESARDARTRFEVGAATQLEVLDAEQLVVSASVDLALAEIELQQARLALSYVVGAFDPGVQMTSQKVTGISPVKLGSVGAAGNAHAQLESETQSAQATPLVPSGRAGRDSMLAAPKAVPVTPTAMDLLRAGLVESGDSLWSRGP